MKKIGPTPRIAMVPMEVPEGTELTPEEKAYRANLDQIQKCATAVGNLCFAWAGLETTLDKFINSFLKINHAKVQATLAANIDVRAKINIVLGLGYLLRKDNEWFDSFKWCLDTVDDNLRPRRNRFVHDLWHVSAESIKRVQKKTGFRRAKSHQPLEYYTEITEQVTEEDVWALQRDVSTMIIRLEVFWWSGVDKGVDWKKLLAEHAPLPSRKQ
jgi:hypothetical protein